MFTNMLPQFQSKFLDYYISFFFKILKLRIILELSIYVTLNVLCKYVNDNCLLTKAKHSEFQVHVFRVVLNKEKEDNDAITCSNHLCISEKALLS